MISVGNNMYVMCIFLICSKSYNKYTELFILFLAPFHDHFVFMAILFQCRGGWGKRDLNDLWNYLVLERGKVVNNGLADRSTRIKKAPDTRDFIRSSRPKWRTAVISV